MPFIKLGTPAVSTLDQQKQPSRLLCDLCALSLCIINSRMSFREVMPSLFVEQRFQENLSDAVKLKYWFTSTVTQEVEREH